MRFLGNEPLDLMQQGNGLWLHSRCYVSDSMAQEAIVGRLKNKNKFLHTAMAKKHDIKCKDSNACVINNDNDDDD